MPCFDLSIVPAALWNCGAFDSMPKLAGVISLQGFKQGFWQSFDSKNVPTVLGIYPGSAKIGERTRLPSERTRHRPTYQNMSIEAREPNLTLAT